MTREESSENLTPVGFFENVVELDDGIFMFYVIRGKLLYELGKM